MRGELVVFDLETTGLDSQTDEIIEIGAVKIIDGEISDEFSTLVNPGFPVSEEISYITGIYNEDLTDAPRIESVLPQFETYAGASPLVAHNIRFDVSFLRKKNVLTKNANVDTLSLASILLPSAPRYTLTTLTDILDVRLENAHRALSDAQATALVYWKLWEKAISLPPSVLYEINTAAKDIWWQNRRFFQEAYQTALNNAGDSKIQPISNPFQPDKGKVKTLKSKEQATPLDLAEIDHVLADGGLLSQSSDSYEFRPQQVEMAHTVTEAFNYDQHWMIEAGTGTGKSIAYLVPAITWAVQNQQRVVVSTNTINLQDQLMNKEIPQLQDVLDTPFRASVMKGRANYLCPRRLAAVRRRKPSTAEELHTLAKILIWLQETKTGDRSELSLRGAEFVGWNRISAQHEHCSMETCRTVMNGTCPLYKARRAAEAAHIVIVNHALLISDAMSENRVLPEYKHVVIDEAHHLEDAITHGLSTQIDQIRLIRRIDELGTPNSGIFGELLNFLRDSATDKDIIKIETFIQKITAVTELVPLHVEAYFSEVYQLLQEIGALRDLSQRQYRIHDKHRNGSAFMRLQDKWESLAEFLETLTDAMGRLVGALERMKSTMSNYDKDVFDERVSEVSSAAAYLGFAHDQLGTFAIEPDPNTVYWVNLGRSAEEISIETAPIHIGQMMQDYLWESKQSIVLTSATLQTQNNFEHLKDRLNAFDVETIALGSPFNYRNSTLIFVPDDLPEPNHPGYQRKAERALIQLADATDGRLMVLFTSYSHLRQTARAVTPRLALGNITVFDQSTSGSSRQALLSNFKTSEKAILMGTKSFWEGVDIAGEQLSALMMMRLPFTPPTDPVFAARSEGYENHFREYAIPDAILRFRQGFGRLIRTQTDRGIVVIFDTRIISKSYGHHFLDSLPDCELVIASLDTLPETASEWISNYETDS